MPAFYYAMQYMWQLLRYDESTQKLIKDIFLGVLYIIALYIITAN